MPLYTPRRQRVILLLLLSSMLLVTLDRTGSSVFDRARVGFGYVIRPFEIVGETVARPVKRTWNGITRVDDLEARVAELQDQIDSQRGAEIAGRSALAENADLRAAVNLQNLSAYDRVTASIVGAAPTNFAQQVEIDRGSSSGIESGMAVINSAGLVGRITQVAPDSSIVMLLTDPSYHVQVKIVGFEAPPAEVTESTVPSGLNVTDVTTTTTTTTTTIPGATGDSSGTADPGSAVDSSVDSSGDAASGATADAVSGTTGDAATGDAATGTTSSTTSTTLARVTRETGVLDGYGVDRLPRVRFVANAPQFGTPAIGDLVLTTGGRSSLAPPDLAIGTVKNIIVNPGAAGLELEIEPSANLRQLNFLTVVLYKPPTEIVTGN